MFAVDEINQVIVYVIGTLVAASLVGAATAVIRRSMKANSTSSDIGRYVLPHFIPPTHEEIRRGSTDNTIPARLESLEEDMRLSQISHKKVSEDLSFHLIEEMENVLASMERERQRDDKIDNLLKKKSFWR